MRYDGLMAEPTVTAVPHTPAERHAPIEPVGNNDLLRHARGQRLGIIDAHQMWFLRAAQTIPLGKAIELRPDALADVDNTTDVRAKLGLYESSVISPRIAAPPGGARADVPLSLCDDSPVRARSFRAVPTCSAFPDCPGQEIHRVLNEPDLAAGVSNRLARAPGASENTPVSRSFATSHLHSFSC